MNDLIRNHPLCDHIGTVVTAATYYLTDLRAIEEGDHRSVSEDCLDMLVQAFYEWRAQRECTAESAFEAGVRFGAVLSKDPATTRDLLAAILDDVGFIDSDGEFRSGPELREAQRRREATIKANVLEATGAL